MTRLAIAIAVVLGVAPPVRADPADDVDAEAWVEVDVEAGDRAAAPPTAPPPAARDATGDDADLAAFWTRVDALHAAVQKQLARLGGGDFDEDE